MNYLFSMFSYVFDFKGVRQNFFYAIKAHLIILLYFQKYSVKPSNIHFFNFLLIAFKAIYLLNFNLLA